MYSQRFHRAVRLTDHARKRMTLRGITEATVLDIIETGTSKGKDDRHVWLYKHFPERADNLLCLAVVLSEAVIVKTVMHRFVPED